MTVRQQPVLTCDNCGQCVSPDAGELTSGPGAAMAIRQWAETLGWRYVQAMVPAIDDRYSRSAVRRSWDLCGDCGIPAELKTTLGVGYGRPVTVTVLTGVAVVRGHSDAVD